MTTGVPSSTIPTTGFPQGIGLGATWDPEIVRRAAMAEALEARYIFQSPKYDAGGLIVLSPNADMGRDPRWGRTEECYGEDPYLNGQLVAAFVRGLQGDDPRYWTTASLLKHFLANSNEEGRDRSSSDFDERLFHEYYAAPFRSGIVGAGSRAFMAAYNKVNGIPMAVSPILKEVAVERWGQDGIICTDGGAMRLLVTAHKYFPDLEHAAAACIKAGITMFLDDYRAAWSALTSSDPTPIVQFATTRPTANHWLEQAMHLMLRRFPDRTSGLTHWDQLLLMKVPGSGPTAGRVIAHAMTHDRNDTDPVGDAYLLGRLKRMADKRQPKPLLELAGDLTSIRYGDITVALTPFGRDVLDGKASSYPENPIDDWAAGVHLSSIKGQLWFREGDRLVPATH